MNNKTMLERTRIYKQDDLLDLIEKQDEYISFLEGGKNSIRLKSSLSSRVVITAVDKNSIWYKEQGDIMSGQDFERVIPKEEFYKLI